MKYLIISLVILVSTMAQAKKANGIDFQVMIEQETLSQEASYKDLQATLSEPSEPEERALKRAREERIIIKSGEAHILEFADKKQPNGNRAKKAKATIANSEKLQEDDFTSLEKELELLK